MVSFLTIAGTMALMSGSIGYLIFPMALTFGVKQAINLAENGLVYPLYMNPPFATRSSFHLYAIRNPREVLRGAKMSLERKGPYEFNTYLVRKNVMFMKESERVQFESSRKLVPINGTADLDEKMWLINPILPSTLRSVKMLLLDRVPFQRLTEPIVLNSVNLLLDNFKERLIMRTTPRTILMGRKVELLESLSGLAGRFGLSALVPPGPPKNTFGLAFHQNETTEKVEIWTGLGQSKDRFAEVSKWEGKARLELWRGKCNTINGTNGELYKPFLEEGKAIRIFLGPLCRSLLLEPAGEGSVVTASGIRALEYELSPRLYMGARNNPANKCFCENTRAYDCQYDGLIRMGPCFFDAPLFFSRANMKGVDERIKRLVDFKSLVRQPVSENQSFSIEPITGTVLQANLTILALFKVTRQAYMRDLSKVQNLTYAPLFVTTESVLLPFEYAWQIYLLQKFNDYHKPIMAGMAASGLGMFAFKYIFGL